MAKDDDAAGGISKLAGGLADLINLLVDLDKNGSLPRRGRREKDGVTVEYSVGGRPMAPAEDDADGQPPPRAARPAAKPGQPDAKRAPRRTEIEVIEPVTDIFDEADETVLLFELPGVARDDVRCLLDGDILLLDAKAEGRLYRKEVLIEARLTREPPKLQLHNGVLEVRLRKLA